MEVKNAPQDEDKDEEETAVAKELEMTPPLEIVDHPAASADADALQTKS